MDLLSVLLSSFTGLRDPHGLLVQRQELQITRLDLLRVISLRLTRPASDRANIPLAVLIPRLRPQLTAP